MPRRPEWHKGMPRSRDCSILLFSYLVSKISVSYGLSMISLLVLITNVLVSIEGIIGGAYSSYIFIESFAPDCWYVLNFQTCVLVKFVDQNTDRKD